MRGELIEYNLQASRRAPHAYEALSYVWGQSDEHESIQIGEDHLEVTPNLHAALLRLRDPGLTRVNWIDAICINQADNEEKSHQIQRMAQIYGVASRVLVWLGEAADDSDQAIEIIRSTDRVPKRRANGFAMPAPRLERYSLNALLQRSWFRRIWVRLRARESVCIDTKRS
jgi:hypothetical protein